MKPIFVLLGFLLLSACGSVQLPPGANEALQTSVGIQACLSSCDGVPDLAGALKTAAACTPPILDALRAWCATGVLQNELCGMLGKAPMIEPAPTPAASDPLTERLQAISTERLQERAQSWPKIRQNTQGLYFQTLCPHCGEDTYHHATQHTPPQLEAWCESCGTVHTWQSTTLPNQSQRVEPQRYRLPAPS